MSGAKVPPKQSLPLAPGAQTEVVLSIIFPILATVAVGLRFWSKSIKRSRTRVDDWLIVIGLVFAWGYAVNNILYAYIGGLGYTATQLAAAGREDWIKNELKIAISGQLLYAVALGCIKSSICVSLMRIFHIVDYFRFVGGFVLMLCLAWALQTILIAFLICTPLSYNWDQSGEGHCGDLKGAYLSVGVVDVVTDVLIFFIPIPIINRLNMPLRHKLASTGIFLLGLLTIAAGSARMVAVLQVSFRPTDVDGALLICEWAVLEPCIAIIVACGLTLRPLLIRWGTALASLSWGRGSGASSGNNNDGGGGRGKIFKYSSSGNSDNVRKNRPRANEDVSLGTFYRLDNNELDEGATSENFMNPKNPSTGIGLDPPPDQIEHEGPITNAPGSQVALNPQDDPYGWEAGLNKKARGEQVV